MENKLKNVDETEYLLSSTENKKRLLESIRQTKFSEKINFDLEGLEEKNKDFDK